MTLKALLPILAFSFTVEAKVFQNSYVSFEVPDDWSCLQEGVAWTCTPQNAVRAKEAVIVLVAKVAGPQDNTNAFLAYLKQPKMITSRVGTPIPSKVMYAQNRMLDGTTWVQAQHLGSEMQEFYTLYLATVKEQLSILISFSVERNQYQKYNPIFDKAIKTLKIVASQQLLFHKKNAGTAENFGIQGEVQGQLVNPSDLAPPPEKKSSPLSLFVWVFLGVVLILGVYVMATRKGNSPSKKRPSRSK